MSDLVPPQAMLSAVALLFAALFGLRARAVMAGKGTVARDDEEFRERGPPRIPPATWPILGVLASLAIAFFVWTPAFPRLIQSGTFAPLIFGTILGWTGSELAVGLATGRMSAVVKGKIGPFSRRTQPKRYWASAIWNTLFSVLMVFAILGTTADLARNACTAPSDDTLLTDVEAACDRQLAASTIDPTTRSTLLTGRAYARLDEDNGKALADLDQALALDRDNGWAWHLRGYARLRRGQFEAADADLSQAIRLRPDRASAYFDRARARASYPGMAAAVADVNRAIALDPQEADHFQLRAEFERALGQPDLAARDFATAKRLRSSARTR